MDCSIVSAAVTVMIVLGVARCARAADAGLVAAYDFDKGAGEVLADGAGNGNDGRVHGAEWVKLGDRRALRFDGADDHVDCGTMKAVDPAGPFTIEAWFKADALPVGDAHLLGRGFDRYALTYSGASYPARVYFHVGGAKKKSRARAVAGLWHHVVATYDGNLLREYIDGTTAGGVRVWRHAPKNTTDRFLIGGGAKGIPHFKGMIGGVSVYSRALSREEAFERYVRDKDAWPRPQPPRRRPFGEAKVLNNLVAELLRVDKAGPADHPFTNPRDGWVFIAVTADADSLDISLDGRRIPTQANPASGDRETMRRLDAGSHTLSVSAAGQLGKLVIRAIPELAYGAIPRTAYVPAFGEFDWAYLAKDVLPNVTTLLGLPDKKTSPQFEEYKARGREVMAEHSAGWYDYAAKKSSQTADDFYRLVTSKPGMSHPLTDGVLLDTHDVGHNSRYKAYADAVRRIRGEAEYSGKRLAFYCDCLYGAPMSELFARTIRECGYRFFWTRYLHEQPTERVARAFIESHLSREALGWEQAVPGFVESAVMALGYLTSPGERMNVEPGVNYLVFMDMQCHALANDPAFRGLGGVMWYKATYVNEQPVRWAGRLFRHYFIEGNTERLSKDPYELTHVQNPDFNDGTNGWTLQPAEAGSMEARYLDRFGFVQGRWLETGVGDRFLWMRRAEAGPNRVSQQIRDLQPGRRYSLTLYSIDYKALLEGTTNKQERALSIEIADAEPLPEKSFQHVYPNFSYYHLGPYDDKEPTEKTWQSFHHRVFRATSETARLTVSDWSGPTDPGGAIGRELAVNFVEVQPYLE